MEELRVLRWGLLCKRMKNRLSVKLLTIDGSVDTAHSVSAKASPLLISLPPSYFFIYFTLGRFLFVLFCFAFLCFLPLNVGILNVKRGWEQPTSKLHFIKPLEMLGN